jgi:phosphoribosylformylglycinamidine (FGAM) synthase PurS component
MEKELFTKETAWMVHKRWWKKKVSETVRSMNYLDLCEEMTWKKRWTIVSEFSKNWLKTNLVEDVEIYLRGRIVGLIEKQKSECREVQEIATARLGNPSVEDLRKLTNNIMNSPKPVVTTIVQPIPWVYVPQVDKYWFSLED